MHDITHGYGIDIIGSLDVILYTNDILVIEHHLTLAIVHQSRRREIPPIFITSELIEPRHDRRSLGHRLRHPSRRFKPERVDLLTHPAPCMKHGKLHEEARFTATAHTLSGAGVIDESHVAGTRYETVEIIGI